MPYANEFANPRGYEDLVLNEYLKSRLSTFRFQPPAQEEESSLLTNFEAKDLEELESPIELDELRFACAVDGSIARLEEESLFELAALKLGSVLEKLKAMDALSHTKGVIDPTAVEATYQVKTAPLLLSGRGIYGEDDTEAFWQDKFRFELNEALKHIPIPGSPGRTMHQALKSVMPRHKTVACFTCSLSRGIREKDVQVSKGLASCPRCAKEHYLTDGLFADWAPLKDSANNIYLHLMTTLERLMLQGMMEAAHDGESSLPFKQTLFLTDGSLAFYGPFHSLNEWFLRNVQKWEKRPLLMSLEKHGAHRTFALTPEIQALVKPGQVALVPTEVSTFLSAKTQESSWGAPLYAYGKRFIYRSRDGDKTFVLMVPPAEGRPHKFSEDDELADSWSNYPTVKICCEFLENHTIAQFGPNEPAIDIMAKANHAASLPKMLSSRVLKDMVRDLQNDLLK